MSPRTAEKESKTEGKTDSTIMLRNVRLAFPDLFVATQFEGAGKYSYKATFLVAPNSQTHKVVNDAIAKAASAKWGAKAAQILESVQGQSQKFCYIDGNKKDYDGFENMWALATSRQQESGPPKVIDRDMQDLTAADGRPYGGCYVNAKVQIWAQDNQWGKAVRASLITVQFVNDGDAFGGPGPATAEGFEEVAESGDDLL